MAVVKINLSCELSEAVKVQYLHGNLFSQDNQANVINVAVFEDGEPVELAGTVTANVIRPDGGTVAVTGGTYSGNVATITMPSAVYAIPGAISVAVKITLDSVVTTIAAFAATVYATSTDTAVDPGTIIPSIQTLIAEIEAAVDSIPADYSSLWATLAPNYSNLTFPVAVGQYCTYDGGFYRCNTAIATQEAWTAAHWTATNIGADLAETILDVANLEDDVSELKSAIGTVPTGKTVQGQIEALQTGKADMIVVTDSTPAAVMSFPDGADDQPMKLEVAIDPVQDLHGYDYPWPAGGGKNKLDEAGTIRRGYLLNKGFVASDSYITYYDMSLPAGQYKFITDLDDCYITRYYIGNTEYSVTHKQNNVEFELTEASTFSVSFRNNSTSDISSITPHSMVLLSTETDTTYAPYSNICPISGWTGAKVTRTGKNLFNKNGTNFVKGYPDSEKFNTNNNQGTYYFKCVRGKTYTVSKIATSATGRMGLACCHSVPPTDKMPVSQSTSKSNFNVGERASITITADDDYLLVWAYRKNNDEDSMDTLQFEEGSVATAYEAYAGTEYPVTWQTEAGTVYGGTLTLNQDGTGSLVVDRKCLKVSEFSWIYGSNENRFVCSLSDAMPTQETPDKLISSFIQTNTNPVVYMIEGKNGICILANKQVFVRVPNQPTSVNDFVAQYGNETICYTLATPVTYTLTAPQVKTLLGLNNVWADTGDILSVEYSADTKLFIEKLTQPTEDDMTANNLIESGKFFMIGNGLYYSTSQIQAGAKIIPGSNCTALSLAEALNNLNT